MPRRRQFLAFAGAGITGSTAGCNTVASLRGETRDVARMEHVDSFGPTKFYDVKIGPDRWASVSRIVGNSWPVAVNVQLDGEAYVGMMADDEYENYVDRTDFIGEGETTVNNDPDEWVFTREFHPPGEFYTVVDNTGDYGDEDFNTSDMVVGQIAISTNDTIDGELPDPGS